MAQINMDAVKGPELKNHIKVLNESGLLEEGIVIRPGRKNVDLANEFIAGIERCNDIGKLDDVPEAVFTYYTTIVVPESKAGTTAQTGATPPPQPPPAPVGRGRGAAPPTPPPVTTAGPETTTAAPPPPPPPPPPVKRITRADVFAEIVKDGSPLTKADMEERMKTMYSGSGKDTGFWVNAYVRLCLSLGVMVKNEDKTFTYLAG